MGKTIIQSIGPLYGEVVNGTVFGRPNGSVYVPSSNTVTLNVVSENIMNAPYSGGYYLLGYTDGNRDRPCAYMVAESQDLASYMQIEVYSDEELTTLVGFRTLSAGLFNTSTASFATTTGDPYNIVAGETYYVVCKLMSSSGDPVAVSEVATVIGVE